MRAVAVALLAGLALVSPALAKAPPAYPPYPADRDQASMAAWLAAQTDIDPGTVVGVGDTSLFAVEAALAALDDAGLKPTDIDGFVPYMIGPTSEDLMASLGLLVCALP